MKLKLNALVGYLPASILSLGLFLVGPQLIAKIKLDKELAEHVPGELIVKFKAGRESVLASDLGSVEKIELKNLGQSVHVLKLENKASLEKVMKALNNDPRIAYAEPNYIYRVVGKRTGEKFSAEQLRQARPSDPKFDLLWGLENTGDNEPDRSGGRGSNTGNEGADINALRAWEVHTGSRDVKVAVIDTGIDYNHPDLKDNMWVNEAELNGEEGVDDDGNGFVDDIHGYDFVNNDGDPMDGHDHGTHCAGTIGAVHNNDAGVAGVMATVTLVGVKFLSDSGSGSTADAIRAIDYATALDVDVMSNSWGGGGFSQALFDSIKSASDAGILFIAAAGNSSANNDTGTFYPANYEAESVISVAAHTAQDDLASFSNYGRQMVHVAAPGHNILSTTKGDTYSVFSGTSMATPHVAGLMGLLVSKEGRGEHTVYKERLMMTSQPVATYRRKTVTGGRADAYNLLMDERPVRNEPKPEDWIKYELDQPLESSHPYTDNSNDVETIKIEGAKYIRVVVEKFELEQLYDFLHVVNPVSRATIEKISGDGENFVSDYIEGDQISIKFTSDSSVTKWGYKITTLEYIPAE